jgi:CBS domain-containing protein
MCSRATQATFDPVDYLEVEPMVRSDSQVEGSYVTPSIEHATVKDAMRPEVLTCPPDASLRDVARTMASEHVHAVVVAGGGTGDRGWGIVSDMDVLRATREDIDERTASWAAASEFLSVSPEEALERAVQMMVEHDVTHLVVIDPAAGKAVGVLSTLDVAGLLAWGRA